MPCAVRFLYPAYPALLLALLLTACASPASPVILSNALVGFHGAPPPELAGHIVLGQITLPPEKERSGTIRLDEASMRNLYSEALIRLGLLTSPPKLPVSTLNVTITHQDTGAYIGLAKTAKITVAYSLTAKGKKSPTTWTDTCRATAPLSLTPAPERNAQATSACLRDLLDRLAKHLSKAR